MPAATRGLGPSKVAATARRWGWLAPVVGGAVLFSWLLVLVAWLLLPSARAVEFEIPLGTAERIAAGEDVQIVPDELLLRRGDTLVIVNADSTVHRIGAAWAAPGRTTRTKVGAGFFTGGSVVCTVHPGGAIGVSPESRPGLEATALPTTLLAVPLAIAASLAFGVARRLDLGSDLPGGNEAPADGRRRALP